MALGKPHQTDVFDQAMQTEQATQTEQDIVGDRPGQATQMDVVDSKQVYVMRSSLGQWAEASVLPRYETLAAKCAYYEATLDDLDSRAGRELGAGVSACEPTQVSPGTTVGSGAARDLGVGVSACEPTQASTSACVATGDLTCESVDIPDQSDAEQVCFAGSANSGSGEAGTVKTDGGTVDGGGTSFRQSIDGFDSGDGLVSKVGQTLEEHVYVASAAAPDQFDVEQVCFAGSAKSGGGDAVDPKADIVNIVRGAAGGTSFGQSTDGFDSGNDLAAHSRCVSLLQLFSSGQLAGFGDDLGVVVDAMSFTVHDGLSHLGMTTKKCTTSGCLKSQSLRGTYMKLFLDGFLADFGREFSAGLIAMSVTLEVLGKRRARDGQCH
eukprot:TRINITY_DN5788_c0_g1_i1.p1 TRINITY_DN5788_c0_g1~~TRINITY_DN5788_c0_g1_i1.p1  ORF type:complete len:429 (-),score=65.73 TRINITY_DN5788_c0_g1_i1:69-1208(-)